MECATGMRATVCALTQGGGWIWSLLEQQVLAKGNKCYEGGKGGGMGDVKVGI